MNGQQGGTTIDNIPSLRFGIAFVIWVIEIILLVLKLVALVVVVICLVFKLIASIQILVNDAIR